MSRYKIHILYEYGSDLRPHGSAFIRLLRPLTHPLLSQTIEVTHACTYEGQAVDAVIVDRFWHHTVTFTHAANLVEKVRSAGAKLIYALDDNLLELSTRNSPWLTAEHFVVVEFFLRQADAVWVTTPPLREQLLRFNPNITIIPNTLDERLLCNSQPSPIDSPFSPNRIVIGYMGTLTHDDDLLMVLPALQRVWQRHPEDFEFQIVGVMGHQDTLSALGNLPVRVVNPKPGEIEYPLFMLWFSGWIKWDVAIAPLQDNSFNHCKSDIKFLDYSAIGAAGIYSRVPAYESSVRHQQTGWLVENEVEAWVEALEESLLNKPVRIQMAHKATQYLYNKRILARCGVKWVEIIHSLIGRG